jgi:ABC-type Fe3+-siderophore transport system permease subunit
VKPSKWHQASIGSGVFFAGFSAVHLIDDFLFGVPSDFHLSVPFTELLALAYMVALVGLVSAASHRTPAGYLGLTIAGILITLAQLLKSVPEILQPGPWHSGTPSELLAAGLAVSACLTAVTSYQARKDAKERLVPPP